jgi:hypothetical protein
MEITKFFSESIEDFLTDSTDYTDYCENEIMKLFRAIENN